MPSMPALTAEYATSIAAPETPQIEETLTIAPALRRIIDFAACWESQTAEERFAPTSAFHAAGETASKNSTSEMPAPLTSTSMGPSADSLSAQTRAQASGSERSPCTAKAVRPSALSASASACAASKCFAPCTATP